MNEIEEYIHGICKKYYAAFMNGDVKEFNANLAILEDAKENEEYNNIDKFLPYSMLLAINSLLNELMDRKMKLIMLDEVKITREKTATEKLLEQVRIKRQELYDLQNHSSK